ncbi:MAG: hypothetical protein A2Y92_04990 [Chloroflexi bacterium RBG_13_57_8]|nr:MAG: hypothetical protein A2Y92_04990 [Chloroflexi bacterium RBG_13_57_8]
MSKNRIFTPKELKEMGTRTLDLVLEAIDAGDKEKAKELANRMYREFNHLHDGYMTWVTGLLSFIYTHYGIEVVEKAEREAHTIEAKFVFKPSGETDFRSRVEAMVGGLRGHLQPISVVEDDEKVTIAMKPCGSGERIIRMGGYEPEIGLARVKEPHRITYGMEDFPIYCVHCPVMEMLDIERSGDFTSVKIVSDPIGKEHCRFALYKDNRDIPAESYKRIGKRKPRSR